MQDSPLKPHLRLVQKSTQAAPIQAPDFAAQLTQFSAHPESPVVERRFAAQLLTTHLFALVYSDAQKHLATTTYLADGKRYLPVFTSTARIAVFLDQLEAPMRMLCPERFSSQTLMAQAQTFQLAGLLIDPGTESLPLSQSYWRYINQVLPVIDPDLSQVVFDSALDVAPVLTRLAEGVSGADQIAQLWVAGVRLTAEDTLCLAVIADYRGFALGFDADLAPVLARICQPLVPKGVDVLVGTLKDPLGRLVASTEGACALNHA